MPGLSSDLYQRCRETLLRCSELDSDATLQTVFVTEELRPFRDRLPAATNKSGRVDACLGFLVEQRLSDRRPVLQLFLEALRDKYQPGDVLHDELNQLARLVQLAPVLARQVCRVPQATIDTFGENIVLLPNASMDSLTLPDGRVVGVKNRLTGRIRFAFAYSSNRVCDISIPQVLRSRLGVSVSSTNDLEIFYVAPQESILVREVCKVPQRILTQHGKNSIILSEAIAQILKSDEGQVIKVVSRHNSQKKLVTAYMMNRVCELGVPKVLRGTLGVRLGQDNELELWKV